MLNNNNDNNASDHTVNGEDSNGSCFTERKYNALKGGKYRVEMGRSDFKVTASDIIVYSFYILFQNIIH